MPYFEHTATVARTPDYVAAALAAAESGPLFAPPVARITLDERGGRAADLAYEQVRTRPTGPTSTVDRTGSGGTVTSIAAAFAGSGVEGALTYRLVPAGDATTLVQRVEYEFADWAAVDLLEPETADSNDRQFAERLDTVRDLLEAGSRLLPAHSEEPSRQQ